MIYLYIYHSIAMIYIASMNMRGKWAKSPDSCLKLNVTSMQSNSKLEKKHFSPMSPVCGCDIKSECNHREYKSFWNFESYWQSHKVFQDIDYTKTLSYWKENNKPKRRYPNSKNKKVLYAKFDNKELDYIESRKKIYIPEYFDLVKNTESMLKWKKLAEDHDIVVYDFDGPRDDFN